MSWHGGGSQCQAMAKRLVLLVSFTTAFLVLPGMASAQSRAPRCSTGGQVAELSTLDLEGLLNTRIITASRFSEQESDAPGVISVVSRDEMRRFGGTTLRDVLERVPGLSGTTAYFTAVWLPRAAIKPRSMGAISCC
jgi:outer membrane receptor for Fe3+-dicitrate